jgi:hypothetical protein
MILEKEKIKVEKNIEIIVRNFLNKKDAAMYNFRLENPKLTNLNDKDIPILNFKYYKQDCRQEYQKKHCCFDADSCELTMSIWCLLLEHADFVKEVKGYDGRTIVYVDNSNGDCVEVETDTVNSLERELNKFIHKVVDRRFKKTLENLYPDKEIKKAWVYLYQNGIKIINGELVKDWYHESLREEKDLNRDWWLIDNYEEIFDERFLTASEIINLSALNEFAKRVHTIGNFMIGPKGFNWDDKKAKSNYEDRFDKFMKEVLSCKDYEEWKKWFEHAKSILYIDDYFENKFNEDTTVGDVKCLRNGDISEWCKLVCTLIENRSNIIIDKLKEILNEIPELK